LDPEGSGLLAPIDRDFQSRRIGIFDRSGTRPATRRCATAGRLWRRRAGSVRDKQVEDSLWRRPIFDLFIPLKVPIARGQVFVRSDPISLWINLGVGKSFLTG